MNMKGKVPCVFMAKDSCFNNLSLTVDKTLTILNLQSIIIIELQFL